MKLSGLSIMAIGFGLNSLVFAAAVFGSLMAAMTAFLVKVIGDFVFLASILKKQQREDLLLYFPWFELYFVGYVLILPFMVFFGGRVMWKGRAY